MGVLAEPLAVATYMIALSSFREGTRALVLGVGPIGLVFLLLLKSRGAARVLVSEVTNAR